MSIELSEVLTYHRAMNLKFFSPIPKGWGKTHVGIKQHNSPICFYGL